jgi:hypothetical protein
MENTRAPENVVDCAEPKLSKYYMVLVQYCATIDAEKLRSFIIKVRRRETVQSQTSVLKVIECLCFRSMQRAFLYVLAMLLHIAALISR